MARPPGRSPRRLMLQPCRNAPDFALHIDASLRHQSSQPCQSTSHRPGFQLSRLATLSIFAPGVPSRCALSASPCRAPESTGFAVADSISDLFQRGRRVFGAGFRLVTSMSESAAAVFLFFRKTLRSRHPPCTFRRLSALLATSLHGRLPHLNEVPGSAGRG